MDLGRYSVSVYGKFNEDVKGNKMYNRIILVGNLTRDVEIKYTQSGSAIGNTGIATSRKFKSQGGEQKEEVMFVEITFFGRTAEIANQYLCKGSKVLIEGRLKLDQWTAQDGTKRSKHSVTVENLQMLGTPNQNTTPEATPPPQNSQPPEPQPQPPAQEEQGALPDINEDEIPF
jgi:single-strand DNA-binding protein